MTMALVPGEEESATIPISSRPEFSKPCQPRFQPQPRAPHELHTELLGLCSNHLELLGQLLAASTAMSPEAAITAWAKSVEPLKEALRDGRLSKAPTEPPASNEPESPLSSSPSAIGRTRLAQVEGATDSVTPNIRMSTGSMERGANPEMLFKGATISDMLGVDATDWGSQSSNRHIEKLRVYLHTKQVEVFWLVSRWRLFLNTVNMIVEEQYEGGRVGHSLGVYSEMGSDRNLSLEGTLKAMEAMFALMFTIEQPYG
ncbi:unnamed protein product [Prorocentrum cordatum]|uniref:Uncharacterized protein n=1 Tax=Prorocentrum cordatum TaxID=2364126 RepID=A0ABN9SGA3_9DINO|nr:unnamed protein product [Polarella glacialis]